MGIETSERSVLICEDDPAMVRIIQFLLRQQGIRNVFTTGNGNDAPGLALKYKPALILLDLMLPGKDGLTVLQDLKGKPETQVLPVIVVSGKESHEQIQQALIAGAIDYIIKPFEPMELGMRIRTFLDNIDPPRPPDAGGLL
jgi:DNA-binding response OmpR family regulator